MITRSRTQCWDVKPISDWSRNVKHSVFRLWAIFRPRSRQTKRSLPGSTVSPEGAALARAPGTASLYGPASGMTGVMSPRTVDAGGGQPHNNLQPYLTMHFIIALQGVFPPRG